MTCCSLVGAVGRVHCAPTGWRGTGAQPSVDFIGQPITCAPPVVRARVRVRACRSRAPSEKEKRNFFLDNIVARV